MGVVEGVGEAAAIVGAGLVGNANARLVRERIDHYHARMGTLKTEFEVECPCCKSTLIVDEGLKRVVRHVEPERPDKPKLDEAHQILTAEKARRDALFEQSVMAERGRGDALSRRFEEALKQAQQEPVTKPTRDWDLD